MENILNSYENILVYNIYKILIVSKPFHIRFDKMNSLEFIMGLDIWYYFEVDSIYSELDIL